jgi:hypothetical protein
MAPTRNADRRRTLALGLLLACLAGVSSAEGREPPRGAVTVATKFPGGNALVERIEGDTVHLAPDLRGGRPWFYWSIAATATEPGRVRFVFPEKVAGFVNGAIGFQGPAISTDGGETWKWMGTATVQDNAFTHDFAKTGETVRFAVTIPYVQSNLDAFLKAHAKNPHLTKSVLTKSRGGRDVAVLRVGTPGPGKAAVIVTARHHAAETMASYLLEGLLEEALSDTADGKDFRERYVLYAVPFVDADGVEAGDQGKNRKPHDHNRDYGEESIYPEVRAVKKLHADTGFRYALDLHCPTLVMPDHQVMYFVGGKSLPADNFALVSAFAERIKAGLPKAAPAGPLVWLKDDATPAPMFSRYFATREGVVMSATLEFPFAPPGKDTAPDSCRRYGRAVLQAFAGTRFTGDRPKK